ncbi:hypothetical protein IEE94_12040 [Yimella sp. cx-573]|nr:hypothetical protein [Yimella sp. cx-573]
MVSDGYETRNVVSLRTGSKIALLVGISLLGLAAYFYFVPLWVPKGADGGVFGCGSAASPPGGWGKGACQGVNDAAMYRAILCAVLGLLIPAVGTALFGVDKRTERRAVRFDDDDDYYDERPARRRAADTDRGSRRAADDDDFDRDERRARRGGRRSREVIDDLEEESALRSAPKYPAGSASED